MIAVSLPTRGPFGWGVCSTQLTAALKTFSQVLIETDDAGDFPNRYAVPVLHAIQGVNLLPIRPQIFSSVRDVGYCFIEDDLLVASYRLNAERYFNAIATGSKWCTAALKAAGIQNVSTIWQGVSEKFFAPVPGGARSDVGRFIVFSGGKAETRKGQDVVVRAMKVMMERHSDVYLSCAWHNPWGSNIEGYDDAIRALATLPADRVIGGDVQLTQEQLIARYAMSDVGLFPNRCEAGTNLVMMEYMASGKPVIATYATGHVDVLGILDTLRLTGQRQYAHLDRRGISTGLWFEPDLDEVIVKLEHAYALRGSQTMRDGGLSNQARMKSFTWDRCALSFLELLNSAS